MALVTVTCAAANAGTVHHVRFAQPAQILVWEDGALVARGAQIQLSSDAAVISNELAGAGILIPAAVPNQSRRVISVASNSAFALRSRSDEAANRLSVRALGTGPNAALHDSTAAVEPGVLFQQGSKTAIRPGLPESQAIELEITWSGPGTPDLFLIAE